MSKQHSKPTISHRLRRGLAGILTLALLLGLLPAAVVPASAHWADPYVQTLTEWGVMRGDISGNMAPERTITRAEFVTMMNRAYGYTRLAGHPFTDVRTRDWYNEDIDIAYNMGYFKGTSPTTASPNSPLTREQAAVLLARNMMLQPTVGETLGFSDTRSLSDWSRGLVGAATKNGILGGYGDGSFKPQNNITRGEVAAMLVRAIGTPIQTEGDHTLGNVYGNVTVNTSGVKLRDGVVTGNLYLTGGIDLGDVLLENVTVLGEIIVSGSGESNSAQSSIVLRNVKANDMSVDNISGQFVTIRAEGNTDIKTTTVRTSAYVDDSSLPGYGLWKVIQDGGSLLQLAGNAKEVVNKTPNSSLEIVQGTADKVTVDEKATGSSVLVDGDARVDELDLDVATTVTGTGDIKDLNVGAAGSTVEQLPDTVTIRPGITADINGAEMNSSQAAQTSSEPRLLAGYPKAKNVAPNSATLVFSVNKPGTIYWAISAVADGSIGEDDLIENPTYGGKIIQSGTINATAANTEYTANLTGLTQDGSYYISAILVDGRDKRSPVKVTAFSTPDGTVPAFISGPTATMRTTKIAQVTGMPNKSCQLFWALLPEGAAAPTAAQFKSNAITGNLGYGSMDVVKNASQTINVNRSTVTLKEKTTYVAYLWLTDHDGAQSSQVYSVRIYIPDETPPVVNDMTQTGGTATAVEASFTMNETGQLHWGIVTDEDHEKQLFLVYDGLTTTTLLFEDQNIALGEKIRLMAGDGARVSGSTPVTGANTLTRILAAATEGLDPEVYNTSSFVLYYLGEDAEGNLSEDIGYLEVNVLDQTNPEFVEQTFNSYNQSDLNHPLADTDITLVFSEPIQSGASRDRNNRFQVMYQAVEAALANVPEGEDAEKDQAVIDARDKLAQALYKSIKLYDGTGAEVVSDQYHPNVNAGNGNYTLDYRYAIVRKDGGKMYITFPHDTGLTTTDDGGGAVTLRAVNLKSGTTYHFEFRDIYDCAVPPNDLEYNATGCYKAPDFRTAVAEVSLKVSAQPLIMFNSSALADPTDGTSTLIQFTAKEGPTEYGTVEDITSPGADAIPAAWQLNPPQRIDRAFLVNPLDSNSSEGVGDEDMYYDILIWANSAMEVTLYSRDVNSSGQPVDADGNVLEEENAPWTREGSATYSGTSTAGLVYRSLFRDFKSQIDPATLTSMTTKQYAIHVDRLYYGDNMTPEFLTWNKTVEVEVTVAAGPLLTLRQLYTNERTKDTYESVLADGASSIGVPDPLAGNTVNMVFNDRKAPNITEVTISNSDHYPVISVDMDKPGSVNYLIIPLYDLKYGPNSNDLPSNVTLHDNVFTDPDNPYYVSTGYSVRTTVQLKKTEGTKPKVSDIQSIEDYGGNPTFTTNDDGTVTYDENTLLAFPNRYTVTDGEDRPGLVRGVTGEMVPGTPANINLEEIGISLDANTAYFICLVPQGIGRTPVVSDRVFGWRFTTQTAKRPVVNLYPANRTDGNGAAANVSVNIPAAVYSILVNETRLNDTPMGGLFNASAIDPNKYSEFADYAKGKAEFTGVNYTESGNKLTCDATTYSYSILQALQDDYQNDPGSPQCSVFDYFASSYLKGRVREFVESSSAPGVVVGDWNSERDYPRSDTIPSNTRVLMNYEKNDMMFIGRTYICFTVARPTVTDSAAERHGFRAYRPVELQSSSGPKITTADFSGVSFTPGIGISGAVRLQFDMDLYVIYSGQRMTLAQSPATGNGVDSSADNPKLPAGYCGLGNLLGPIDTYRIPHIAPTGPRQNFSIDFLPKLGRMSISFSLPDGLCSYWTIPSSGSISVSYNQASGQWTVTVPDNLKGEGYQQVDPA